MADPDSANAAQESSEVKSTKTLDKVPSKSMKSETSGFKWKDKKRSREDDKSKDDTGRATGELTKKPKKDKKDKEEKKQKKEKKEKKAAAPAPSGEPMIIVNVNDRLGTKAAIPCLASDPIKLFKAQVAARIGRQPHEILLKRQGERPFKDQLTLEDYGVSNGVQLDLELDTGD